MYLLPVQGLSQPARISDPLGREAHVFGEIVTFGWEACVGCCAAVLRQIRLLGAGVAIRAAGPSFGLFGGGA